MIEASESEKNLEDFKKELQAMSEGERAVFLLARGEILAVLKKWPGIGQMALGYVSAEEVVRIEKAAKGEGDPP